MNRAKILALISVTFLLSASFALITPAYAASEKIGDDPTTACTQPGATGKYTCTLTIDGTPVVGNCVDESAYGLTQKKCTFGTGSNVTTLQCTSSLTQYGRSIECEKENPDGSTVTSSNNIGGATEQTKDANGNEIDYKSQNAVTEVAGLLTGAVAWVVLKVGIIILMILTQIALFALWLFGLGFNYVVDNLVVHMGTFINTTTSSGIQTAWQTVRDLANIGIIGGLIAVAVSTILQSQTYSANKFLARLLIAALLVNFSYFFAGAIIDSSNYLATQIYNQVICQNHTDCSGRTIAGRFYHLTHIEALQKQDALQDILNKDTKSGSTSIENVNNFSSAAGFAANGALTQFATYTMFLVLLCVTTFVFLSAVALLIGRFVSLIFILITSPIGIAGSAIPGVAKYAKEWWNILFAQAFFAPIYFLLVGFSLNIIDGSAQVIVNASGGVGISDTITSIWGTDFGNTSSPLSVVLTFLVATTFMLVSLKVAKQLSNTGSAYLGDFYKGAEKVAGWMPKYYSKAVVGGAKWAAGSGAVYTIGKRGDVLSRKYEGWISTLPDTGWRGFVKKNIAGGAVDRRIQKSLDAVAKAKFGTKEGYTDTLHAREVRDARLAERGKFVAAKKKQPELEEAKNKAQGQYDALLNEFGDQGKRASKEDELALAKHGKKFEDLTNEQKEGIMKDKAWLDTYKDLEEMARREHKKSWAELTNKERKELVKEMTKQGRWKGRAWVEDKKTGKWGWETGFPYEDRLRKEIDLRDTNAAAQSKFKKDFDALTEDERAKINEDKVVLQDTIDALREPLNDVSWDIIKEEQLRDHHALEHLTPMLSKDQYFLALKDKAISKATKNEMRETRLGDIMHQANEFEKRVVELSEWEKLSPKDRVGKIVRGSAEYDAYRWTLHEQLKKYYESDEIVDFVESDTGLEDGMRDNRIFNDAITNGVYQKLQKSDKISAGERRHMRGLKRTRYETAIKEDEAANVLFEQVGITTERERDAAWHDDAVAKAMFGDDATYEDLTQPQKDLMNNSSLSVEEMEKILADKGGDKTNEGKKFYAAWLRKRAEAAAEKYFGGKAPEEIATEVKQESFGARLAGRSMRREQLLASSRGEKAKDQAWLDLQAFKMAVHGGPESVNWLKNVSDGQNYNVDWDKVNAEREKQGLDAWQDELKKLSPE